ncbi:MAG: prolyl oligopeptidase family serine peptidase [Acidobacteriota bacterium]
MRRNPMIAILVFLVLTIPMGAQTKSPANFADYGQWESLAPGGSNGGLSPDGRWLAYGINRSSRNNELRVVNLADGTTKVAPFGAQPVFSSDSKWFAYSIGVSETEQERLRTEQRPVQNKLGLVNLATGDTQTFDGIESFSFSPDGAFVAMRRYGAERAAGAPAAAGRGGGGGGRGGAATPSEETPGTTLIVRQLATGHDTSFGNVSQIAWQDGERSHTLAMIINADGKSGNGVQLFDPETSILRVLDSTATTYTDLAWRKDSSDLAVLRAKNDDHKDGSTYAVLAWSGIGKNERLRTYDPTADSTFPAGMRTVSFRRLAWSDDGSVLFFGIAKWDDKIALPAGGRGGRGGRGAGAGVDEPAGLEIWHWTDVVVMPKQKVDAPQDRRRNMLAAWHLDSGKFVQLGKDPVNEDVRPIAHTKLAWVAEWSKYAMNRTIGRPAADLYLQDITTGARTKVKDNVIDRYAQTSPAGKYMLFLLDDQYYTVNLATHAITNVTKPIQASFIDKESDETVKQKPPFGIAGWTKDDAAVLLYDKFDVWQVPPDGSKAQRLTGGAADQTRHRMVRPEGAGGGRGGGAGFGAAAADQSIDLGKPTYMSIYGELSKKSGYARLQPGGTVDRLVWLDKGVGTLAKAKNADVYGYVVQDYDDSPDIFVGGADLKDAKQITHTNAFQGNFAWGHSELVDYRLEDGRAFQGALYYPAGYEPGKKYPMIVYMYEKLSQSVHSYVVPSDTSYYNTTVFTSHGYFVFQPDIVFTTHQPGVSVVKCILPGVKKVVSMGMIDPKRVGCVGHSWGGFDAAYLAASTQGVFAAAVAGAPITDLVSMYGDHHWGPGIAETDHIETGQERMEVPLWEDLKAYTDNSAILNVHDMTVPLLLEEGDADGTVFWHQSIEMYNIARRAQKNVVFLVYNGEDHSLRQRKNQVDYGHRILAWFGHYLNGEPAESWITNGQSFLDRDAEVKRLAAKAPLPQP